MAELKPALMWIIAISLGLAVVPLVMYSGQLYYAEGGQSPDGPGMLLMSVVMTTPVWLGTWLAFAALFLVRYRGGATLRPFFGASPLSILLALMGTAGTIFFAWLIAVRIDYWRATRLPFTLHLLGCAAYCQALRAAAVARSLPQGDARRLADTFS
ncbi:hypothetical protein [Sphingomonas sp.]|uniref:hypothetical protein n=1 Tax=Sphingomonas sp. TaxID=28214 RepID=UPI0035BBADC5